MKSSSTLKNFSGIFILFATNQHSLSRKSGNDCSQLLLKTADEEDKEEEEAPVSRAAANEISTDACSFIRTGFWQWKKNKQHWRLFQRKRCDCLWQEFSLNNAAGHRSGQVSGTHLVSPVAPTGCRWKKMLADWTGSKKKHLIDSVWTDKRFVQSSSKCFLKRLPPDQVDAWNKSSRLPHTLRCWLLLRLWLDDLPCEQTMDS